MIKLLDILNEIEVLDPSLSRKLNIVKIDRDYRIIPKYNPGMEVNNIYDNDHPQLPGKLCFLEKDGVETIDIQFGDSAPLVNYLKKKHIPYTYEDRRYFIPIQYINIIKNPINEIEVLDPTQKIILDKVGDSYYIKYENNEWIKPLPSNKTILVFDNMYFWVFKNQNLYPEMYYTKEVFDLLKSRGMIIKVSDPDNTGDFMAFLNPQSIKIIEKK